MFSEIISTTPFTSEQSDIYFSHFKMRDLSNERTFLDKSFVATLRALLGTRVLTSETFSVNVSRESSYPEADSDDQSILNYFKFETKDNEDIFNSINLVFLSGKNEEREHTINLVGTSLLELMPTWQKVNRVTEFFKQYFSVHCFINIEKRVSVIIADDKDSIRLHHYLQSAIPPALPWFFEDSPVTEDELKLIRSLRESKSTDYLEALDILAKQFDFRSGYVEKILKGAIDNYDSILIDSVKNQSRSKMDAIDTLNRNIRDLLLEKAELDIKVLGLQAKSAESNLSNELVEYFLCNNNLHITNANEGSIEFVVTGSMAYFDEELAERVLTNERSSIFGAIDTSIRALLSAIFTKGILKLRVCAAYKLNLTTGVTGFRNFPFSKELKDFIPNTHIDEYACLGNYSAVMNQLTLNGDFVNVIEQCVASCQSINWGDQTVMDRFVEVLYNFSKGDRKIIELPDRKIATINEAIEWLESQGEYVPTPLF